MSKNLATLHPKFKVLRSFCPSIGYPGKVFEVFPAKSHTQLISEIKIDEMNPYVCILSSSKIQITVIRTRYGVAYLKDQYFGFTAKQSFFDTFDGLRQNLKMI